MDYAKEVGSLLKTFDKLAKGEKLGIKTGFRVIDDMIGSIRKGHLWVVSGYSSTGKSYFLVNLVDNILQAEPDIKIAVFSSELTVEDYILRHASFRAGVWENSLEQANPFQKPNIEKVAAQVKNYLMGDSERVDIFGSVFDFGTIEQKVKDGKYNIIFIDYLNNISIDNIHSEDKAMPLMSKRLQRLAQENGVAVIALSQINNSAMKEDQDTSKVSPFSWGKELYFACDVGILLERQKEAGNLTDELTVRLIKNRRGRLHKGYMKIDPGYKLSDKVAPSLSDYTDERPNFAYKN